MMKTRNSDAQTQEKQEIIMCPTCQTVMAKVEDNRYCCDNRDCLVAYFTPSKKRGER